MKMNMSGLLQSLTALLLGAALLQAQPSAPPQAQDGPPPAMDGNGPGFPPPEFNGAPPMFAQDNQGGPGGFMPGGGRGFGGPGPGFGGVKEKTKLLAQFDKNGDGWLNAEERRAARVAAKSQSGNRGFRGPGRFGGNQNQEAVTPGPQIAPADVKSYPSEPLYSTNVLRTFFLEFENTDWEKELEDFHGTDVDVPAKLIVDGKTYADVGIHFRGASSYMMISAGRKRSLNLSIEMAHPEQRLYGYRTLNLLNSHEDPTFLRTVLANHVARDYIPAPKANLVRLVINGEYWGVYVNNQQFNKDFLKENYGTIKGARWKVPGSPNGQGGFNYLGEDESAYKRIYELKTKDEPKVWKDFIHLCKVLNETAPDKLEQALAPLLDIDGALKFLAIENVLINNDGFWTRASDYDIYQGTNGVFHVIPYDENETFFVPGGPGFGGGPGMGGGRRRGPGNFGGGNFGGGNGGPASVLAPELFRQADKNGDQKLTQAEFVALADTWYDKLDPEKTGKVDQDQFATRLRDILPAPPAQQGFGPRGGFGRQGGRGGFDPSRLVTARMFSRADANHDGSVTRAELKDMFQKLYAEIDTAKSDALSEDKFRDGLSTALFSPDSQGPGGGPNGGPGFGGPGGGFGMASQRVNGVELDPLVSASDTRKPLISKLLAVPALRERYLRYVREIADKWLNWSQLGPLVEHYRALIDQEVKADTRKIDSYEDFLKGVSTNASQTIERPISLRTFADLRRAYLLKAPQKAN